MWEDYIYDSAKKIIAESENAVQKAQEIEQRSIKTIRIGSSFLNPGKVLLDLWNNAAPPLQLNIGSKSFHTMIIMIRFYPLSSLWEAKLTLWLVHLIHSKCLVSVISIN